MTSVKFVGINRKCDWRKVENLKFYISKCLISILKRFLGHIENQDIFFLNNWVLRFIVYLVTELIPQQF